MSAPAFVWAMSRARELKLPVSKRMLLIALADRANGECLCYPSQETLAGDTGLSSRQVRDLAPALESLGLIRIEKKGRLLYYHLNRSSNTAHQTTTNKHRNPVPPSEPQTPEPSSAIPPQTPEPASGNGSVNTGNWTPQYRKPEPSIPEASSDKPLREPREPKKEPPRGPPVNGGAARRGARNAFHDKAREMDQQIAAMDLTIDASPGEVVEFNQFLGQRRSIAYG